ncbi:MAG TPA: bifunctional oligoribonuclease/PAP phosphatase NrnA [Terriglobales bacterium]|nr:bifunctional oligoribonuclease/PAP phosphatase NrnA [Terriglobales bacterium]
MTETISIGFHGPEPLAPILEAAQFLKTHDDYLILCHRKPDGDTVGSAFALREALRQMGKRAQVGCADPITRRYDLITGGEREPALDFAPAHYITVDVASEGLLGEEYTHLADKIDLLIDHHPSCTRFGKLNVVYPSTAAAAEVVWHLIKHLPVEMTLSIAACVYVGISTDTGCFKYSNTSPSCLRLAADIAEMGLELSAYNYQLFMVKSAARLAMEAKVISTARMYHDGRISVGVMALKDREELKATEDDVDDLGSMMRGIEGVEVGLLLKEEPDGTYKVSLRSNAQVNVSNIAEEFGGGGHRRAAGCTVDGPLDKAVEALVKAVLRGFPAEGK